MGYLGLIWQTIKIIIILGLLPSVISWVTALLQLPEFLRPKSFLCFIWGRLVSAASTLLQLHIICAAVITLTKSTANSWVKIVTQIIIVMIFVYFAVFANQSHDKEIIFSDTIDAIIDIGKILLVIPVYLILFNVESLREIQPTTFILIICEFLLEFPIWLIIIMDIAISYVLKLLLSFVIRVICHEK